MLKSKLFFAGIAGLMCFALACDPIENTEDPGKEEPVNEEEPVSADLTVDVSTLEFVRLSAPSAKIKIISNTSWTASSDASWLTLDPKSGEGDGEITVSVVDNDATDGSFVGVREAIISVSGENATAQQVVASQAGWITSISSLDDLKFILARESSYKGVDISLTADLDFGGSVISTFGEVAFNLDGGNHSIKNGTLNKPLFETNNGTISGLVIDNTVTINGVSADFAPVVHNNAGTVKNCTNKADITPQQDVSVVPFLGGVVSKNTGSVVDCRNEGQIYYLVTAAVATSTYGSIGGVVAYASGAKGSSVIVDGCVNTGKVSVKAEANPSYICVGGVVGSTETHAGASEVNQGIIQNCTNEADVNYTFVPGGKGAYPNCGGVAGVVEAYMKNCTNKGAISIANESSETAWTCAHVAGVAAQCAFGAEGCVNQGSVSVTGTYAGGTAGNRLTGADGSAYSCFAGVFASAGVFVDKTNTPKAEYVFKDCHNKAELNFSPKMISSGGPGMVFGGVMGACSGTVEDCTNNSALNVNTNTKKMYVGGVAGSGHFIKNSSNSGNITLDGDGITIAGHQYYTGGVLGYSYLAGDSYDNLGNTGNITIKNFPRDASAFLHYCGGIIGGYKGSMTLSNSVAKCNIVADVPSGQRLGGIAGAFNGEMTACGFEGKISAVGTYNASSGYTGVGGVTGYLNGNITNCSAKGEIIGGGGDGQDCYASAVIALLGEDATLSGGSYDCTVGGNSHNGFVLSTFNNVTGKTLTVKGVGLPTPVDGLYNGLPLYYNADGNTVTIEN